MRDTLKKLVGLDVGNDSVKLARREPGGHGEACYSFPNLIAPYRNNALGGFPGFTSSDPRIISMDTGVWAVGDDAQELSTYTRSHVGYRKYDDPEFDVLINAALGEAYPNAGGPTSMIFSLPVDGFGQANTVAENLQGPRSFTCRGVNLTFDLNPVIPIPETFGAMCYFLLSPSGTITNHDLVLDERGRPQDVVIIDVGGGTTQTVTFRGLKLGPVHGAIERGGLHVLQYINEELKRYFKRQDLDRATLMTVLEYGEFNHAGQTHDVRELVQGAVSDFSSEVLSFWKNPTGIAGGSSYHAAIFGGGWMPYIWPYMEVAMQEQDVWHHNILRVPKEDAYSINAIGIYRYLLFLMNQGHA